MHYLFKGVCPVINTPFFENEEIDFKNMGNIIDYVLNEGCESVCLFAFNSEPYKMTHVEKKESIHKFIEFVDYRAETLIGIVENSIRSCTDLARYAERCGAKGIILYPPALSTPSGEDLLHYFETISSSVKIPVMIQDNPRSTGVFMSMEFLLRAFHEIENFNYLKVECPIPIRKMKALIKQTEGKLKCYSGNGGILAVEAFLAGAWGIMPGAACVGHFVKLYQYIESGDKDTARAIFENILPLMWYEDQSLEFYIACEKELLYRNGIITNPKVRNPAYILDESEKIELFELYDRIKALE